MLFGMFYLELYSKLANFKLFFRKSRIFLEILKSLGRKLRAKNLHVNMPCMLTRRYASLILNISGIRLRVFLKNSEFFLEKYQKFI
jgi:hypothetical protein